MARRTQTSPSMRPSFLNLPSTRLLSFGQFTAETVSSLAQRGNAFWKIIRQGYEILDLEVLNPLRVWAWDDEKGRRHYSIDGKEIKPTDLCHLRLTHMPGEVMGVGPIQACAPAIQGAVETDRYAAQWTSTAGAPPGILTTDQDLSKEQANKYKAQANQTLQYNQGIAVMGKGLQYKRLIFTPAELQFIDAQKNSVTRIARMFGIPAKMLLASVDGSSDTYSNVETENQQFLRQTIMCYLAEIEDALTWLAPRGQHVRFNVDGLLRSDTKTRYEAHQIGLNAGFLSVDEVRAIEGLPAAKITTESEPNNATA
ncbi:phage portal protein [Arcanobacterium hippocoleae]